jgi:hypothetical protein
MLPAFRTGDPPLPITNTSMALPGPLSLGEYRDPCELEEDFAAPIDHEQVAAIGGDAAVWELLAGDGDGVSAELFWSDVHSVVLITEFEGAQCPPGSKIGQPIPDPSHRLVFASAEGLQVYSFVPTESGETIQGKLLSAPVAPMGAGGECIFTNLYLAVSSSSGGRVTVTPILDGRRMEGCARTVSLDTLEPRKEFKRFEIALSEPLEIGGQELGRQAMRGTWFQVEVAIRDVTGCGRVQVDGVELEWGPVIESHPGRTYAEDGQEEYESDLRDLLVFATAEGLAVYGGDVTDLGEPVLLDSTTSPLAVAGVRGEAIFTNLYVTVTRSNRNSVVLELAPIVDGELQEPIELALPGVDSRIAEVHELPLSVSLELAGQEIGRQAMRGTWFQVRPKLLDQVEEGIFVLDGIELEFDTVIESEEPV